MRPVLIVIDSPRFNLLSGIVQRDEHLRIQALVSKAPVDTLNHRMLDGFPGPNDIELHSVLVSPGVERLGSTFAPIVHGDHLRVARPFRYAFEGRHPRRPGERQIRFDSLTVPTPVIHDGQRANPPAIQQCISHTIHTPSLLHLARARGHDPQMTGPLSPAREPHGQPFFPVDPVPPLAIHHPAFAAKQDVQAQIANARAGLGQLPQPQANRGIVPPMMAVIPRRSIQS